MLVFVKGIFVQCVVEVDYVVDCCDEGQCVLGFDLVVDVDQYVG